VNLNVCDTCLMLAAMSGVKRSAGSRCAAAQRQTAGLCHGAPMRVVLGAWLHPRHVTPTTGLQPRMRARHGGLRAPSSTRAGRRSRPVLAIVDSCAATNTVLLGVTSAWSDGTNEPNVQQPSRRLMHTWPDARKRGMTAPSWRCVVRTLATPHRGVWPWGIDDGTRIFAVILSCRWFSAAQRREQGRCSTQTRSGRA